MMIDSGTRKAALMRLSEPGIEACLRQFMSEKKGARAGGSSWPVAYLILLARFPMTPLLFVPTAVKATTTARVTRAAATAYSESSSPDSSERNDLIIIFSLALSKALAPLICGSLILFARLLITPLMLLPSVVKIPTTASAIKAAATAYSESSKPVSSRRKFLIMFLLLRLG